jgi:hypothetical protein
VVASSRDAARGNASFLASPWVLALALAGLVATCVAALDVPQGVADDRIVASYPLSVGPFVATLGLHHLGRSVALWLPLVLLGAHLAATVATGGVAGGVAGARPGRWTSIAAAAVAAGALAGLLASGLADAPAVSRDPTRLVVELPGPGGTAARQVVEEGSTYRWAGRDGEASIRFGSGAGGPYAVSATASGRLKAMLADVDAGGSLGVKVAARRPSTGPATSTEDVAARIDAGLSIAALLLSCLLLLATAAAVPGLPEGRRPAAIAALALVAAALVAGPLAGPGAAEVPVSTGLAGDPVAWAVRAVEAGDVAPWLSLIPVRTALPVQMATNAAAAVLALAGLLVLAAAGRRDRSAIPPAAATILRVAGRLWVASAAVFLGYVLFRLAPASAADLAESFHSDVLPRVPMDTAVLSHELTTAGPFSVPAAAGLAGLLAAATAGAALLLAVHRRPLADASVLRFLVPAVLAVAAARGLALAFVAPDAARPAAALPVSLVAAVVAGLAVAIARVRPDREDAARSAAVVAAGLQVVLFVA